MGDIVYHISDFVFFPIIGHAVLCRNDLRRRPRTKRERLNSRRRPRRFALILNRGRRMCTTRSRTHLDVNGVQLRIFNKVKCVFLFIHEPTFLFVYMTIFIQVFHNKIHVKYANINQTCDNVSSTYDDVSS